MPYLPEATYILPVSRSTWRKNSGLRALLAAAAIFFGAGSAGAVCPDGTEPNGSIAQAFPLGPCDLGPSQPSCIDTNGDVDWYSFDVTAETNVEVTVFAGRIGSTLDEYQESRQPPAVSHQPKTDGE